MSRFIAVPVLLLLGAIGAASLSAQDSPDFSAVLGAWEMTFETPRGSITQTLTFAVDGDELTGTVQAQNQTTELEDVTFENGTLSFQVSRTVRDRQITQSFSATVDGDQLSGTFTGGRGRGEREFTAARSSN